MNEYLQKDLKEYQGKENQEIKKLNGDIDKISELIQDLLSKDPSEGFKLYKDLIEMHPEFRVTQDLIMRRKESEIAPIITLASMVSKSIKSLDGIY